MLHDDVYIGPCKVEEKKNLHIKESLYIQIDGLPLKLKINQIF